MNPKNMAILILTAIISWNCTGVPKNIVPVDGFDTNRYLGKWYEIARLDHSFERNLSNVSAIYTQKNSGEITVLNKGFDEKNGKWKQIQGKARLIEDETVGSLKVSFFGPFYGGYHIIALDKKNYSYAMVTGPSRSYLWILSRTKHMAEATYMDLVSKAANLGFKTAELIKVTHNLPDEQMDLSKNIRHGEATGEAVMITPCPSKPNCVSSIDKGRKHFIEPIQFKGSAEEAHKRLLEVLTSMKRTEVVEDATSYIRVEFTSAIMRFVDDAEFYFDEHQDIVHVKSASRVGYSDLGVNRRRIEEIRKLFNERNTNDPY